MAINLTTSSKHFVPVFGGNDKEKEPFAVDILPLRLGDYWELAGKFSQVQGKKEDEISIKDIPSMGDFEVYLKKYITKVHGFNIDGKPGTVEQLFINSKMLPYVMEIITELLTNSDVNHVIKKK